MRIGAYNGSYWPSAKWDNLSYRVRHSSIAKATSALLKDKPLLTKVVGIASKPRKLGVSATKLGAYAADLTFAVADFQYPDQFRPIYAWDHVSSVIRNGLYDLTPKAVLYNVPARIIGAPFKAAFWLGIDLPYTIFINLPRNYAHYKAKDGIWPSCFERRLNKEAIINKPGGGKYHEIKGVQDSGTESEDIAGSLRYVESKPLLTDRANKAKRYTPWFRSSYVEGIGNQGSHSSSLIGFFVTFAGDGLEETWEYV